MANNPVKKKRHDIHQFIMDSDAGDVADGAKSSSSSDRQKEIEQIRKRLQAKELNVSHFPSTTYTRINKKFKRMTPEEKKLHVKFLWQQVRLFILQRNTMSFVRTKVIVRQKTNMFMMKKLSKQFDENEISFNDDQDDDQQVAGVATNIPWYMVHEEGKFYIVWQVIFALTVFFNFLYAPVVTGFPTVRQEYLSTLKVIEYTIEAFWFCSIFV